MTIPSPRYPEDHPERAMDCQFQLEPSFQGMIREAMAAGWTEDDVATAVIDLARNHMRALIADRKIGAEIADAGDVTIAQDNRATNPRPDRSL